MGFVLSLKYKHRGKQLVQIANLVNDNLGADRGRLEPVVTKKGFESFQWLQKKSKGGEASSRYLFRIQRPFWLTSLHLGYGKVQPDVSPRKMKSLIKFFTQDTITGVLITSVVISK